MSSLGEGYCFNIAEVHTALVVLGTLTSTKRQLAPPRNRDRRQIQVGKKSGGTSTLIMAGHQPDYLPWLGYFDKIRECDIFVIEDVVQFEYHGFRNRNRFKTRDGVVWLTVPVKHSTRWQAIRDVEIANDSDRRWKRRHWGTLQTNYGKASHFEEFRGFFQSTYERSWQRLMDLNLHLIRGIMNFMNIDRHLVMGSSLGVEGKRNDLLIGQCKAIGADTYLSGAGGRAYVDVQKFLDEGIKVVFQDFRHPVYKQLHGEFMSNLSVVDYLFNAGAVDWFRDRDVNR